MLTHAIAHRGCAATVRESAFEIDSGRKIPCHTRDSNPCQYCTWLFNRMCYQLSCSSHPNKHGPVEFAVRWITGYLQDNLVHGMILDDIDSTCKSVISFHLQTWCIIYDAYFSCTLTAVHVSWINFADLTSERFTLYIWTEFWNIHVNKYMQNAYDSLTIWRWPCMVNSRLKSSY